MALAFKQVTVNFDTGPNVPGLIKEKSFTAVFNGHVRTAEAVLKGFEIGYSGADHEVFKQEIDIDVDQISGNSVQGRVQFLLRDDTQSSHPFGGYVQLVVIADVQ
jgi:hypothetical protein